jgi:hypothetical protein
MNPWRISSPVTDNNTMNHELILIAIPFINGLFAGLFIASLAARNMAHKAAQQADKAAWAEASRFYRRRYELKQSETI